MSKAMMAALPRHDALVMPPLDVVRGDLGIGFPINEAEEVIDDPVVRSARMIGERLVAELISELWSKAVERFAATLCKNTINYCGLLQPNGYMREGKFLLKSALSEAASPSFTLTFRGHGTYLVSYTANNTFRRHLPSRHIYWYECRSHSGCPRRR